MKTITAVLPPLSRFYTSSTSSGTITCFIHVIKPNGTLKTLFYDVIVSRPNTSISGFTALLQYAYVDDLIESV